MTHPAGSLQTKKPKYAVLLTEKDDIIAAFERSRIPFRSWQEPYTLEHLLTSLREKQVQLIDGGGPKPVLHVRTAVVYIQHYDEGGRLIELYEAHQLFRHSGERKVRGFRGIGETMKKLASPHDRNESPLEGARRALAEEPGYSEPGFRDPRNYSLDFFMVQEFECSSEKYRDLPAVYYRSIFHCKIVNPKIYNPQGYWEYEKEEDKETHFKWKEI